MLCIVRVARCTLHPLRWRSSHAVCLGQMRLALVWLCGCGLGGWARGLAPHGNTRALHRIHGLLGLFASHHVFLMVLPATGFRTVCLAGWGCEGRAQGPLVVCFVVFVEVRRFACRARGVVPAQGLGDSSGLAYTHSPEGLTRGREGGREGGREEGGREGGREGVREGGREGGR